MDPVERIELVDMLKKRIRLNNWKYLSNHNEARAIVRVILQQAVKEEPEDIYEFTANFFSCSNMENIINLVNDQLKRVNSLVKTSSWTEYDGNMLFSTPHQVPRQTSAVDSLLSYAMFGHDSTSEPETENQTSEDIELSVNKLYLDELNNSLL